MPWLYVSEAAEEFSVAESTIRRYLRDGAPSGLDPTGRRIINAQALERWIEESSDDEVDDDLDEDDLNDDLDEDGELSHEEALADAQEALERAQEAIATAQEQASNLDDEDGDDADDDDDD